jgi:uncharacterized membrane protein YfcA
LIYFVLFLSALVAGAINSMAGGGTLLTFPSLLACGVPSITANATSTVALVPGSFSAFLGYRKLDPTPIRDDVRFLLVSAVGGFIGAVGLLYVGDALFSKLVPWLIFGATALFLGQEPLSRWREHRVSPPAQEIEGTAEFAPRVLVGQLFIGIYGGFFGAGSGILMLAGLGFLGFRDIHRMNRLKNLANVTFNTVASVAFAVGRHIDWRLAAIMMGGASLGGYGGAGIARAIGRKNVKTTVIVIGLAMGVYTLVKAYV